MAWINLICMIINVAVAVWMFFKYKKAEKNNESVFSISYFALSVFNAVAAIINLLAFIEFI